MAQGAFTYEQIRNQKMKEAQAADDKSVKDSYNPKPPTIIAIKIAEDGLSKPEDSKDPIQPKDSTIQAKCPECQHVGLMEVC